MKKVSCTHCNLSFDENQLIKESLDGKELYFCCKGCQGVYHLLRDEGLDSFYEKVGNTKLEPASSIENSKDFEKFDRDGFINKYVKQKDNLCEINLIIEGIHCSACVWLNEKVLHKTDGVIEADINYTTHKAKIVWDPDRIKLSNIIEKIYSIGYSAYPYDSRLQEQRVNKRRKDYYIRLLVGIFATMNVMWIAIAQYTGYFTGIKKDMQQVLNVAEFVLATPVLFYTGWVYFRGAYYGLKNHFINMDFLVSVGATLTYIYSIYAMVTGKGEVYFDSVVMIITFIFVGKYLEVLSKKKAVDTLDAITSTIPTEVLVLKDGSKELLSVENIEIGDIVEIKAGDKVVIDGKIVSSFGSFDESALTGESKPVYKKVGDEVISGSVNLDSVIRYKVTKSYENSMLNTIVTLLEDSITKKPEIEKLANKISGYFSVTILVLAIATFIGWYFYAHDFEKSLIVAISVIVIACPCALGLATPVATLIGIGAGSKRGILFKEASFLETMAKSNVLLLDKTGTITEGKPSVVNFKYYKEFDKNLLYSLLKSSNHPISRGVLSYIGDDFTEYELHDMKNIEANGIEAQYKGMDIFGGNLRFIRKKGIDFDLQSNNSIFLFAIDDEVVAKFELNDLEKEGAKDCIKFFEDNGVEVAMLTGDNENVAKDIARKVGIKEVYHSLYPQDKADIIDKYHKRDKVVITVGDGINDSIALSKSDIAIAMGSGSDISVDVSDIVLLDDKMSSLKDAYRLSRITYKNIKQNLALSLIYNLITVPLAISGYVIPLVAALSMSLSSLIVVANAVRIKGKFK